MDDVRVLAATAVRPSPAIQDAEVRHDVAVAERIRHEVVRSSNGTVERATVAHGSRGPPVQVGRPLRRPH
eukprot:2329564-Prymnesium_polylepis.1